MNTFYIQFNMKSGNILKGIYKGFEKDTQEVANNLFAKYDVRENIIGLTDYDYEMNLFVVQQEVEGFIISVKNIFE